MVFPVASWAGAKQSIGILFCPGKSTPYRAVLHIVVRPLLPSECQRARSTAQGRWALAPPLTACALLITEAKRCLSWKEKNMFFLFSEFTG